MEAMLSVDNLHVSYGAIKALHGVSLKVPQGSIITLIGANGAGKSTVARALSGLVPLTKGTIVLAGEDITNWSMWRRRRAGLLQIPEGRGVFSTLSVEENLKMGFVTHASRERRRLLGEAYERYPLFLERRRSRAGVLSGGQQRLLSLVPALVAPPMVLLVDEPTLGLDPAALSDVYEALATLKQQGVTLVIIEQQIDRILAFADHAIVLHHGQIEYQGSPDLARDALERGLTQSD
jgi:branched-chain amino acid transport system ATP-binding protein